MAAPLGVGGRRKGVAKKIGGSVEADELRLVVVLFQFVEHCQNLTKCENKGVLAIGAILA